MMFMPRSLGTWLLGFVLLMLLGVGVATRNQRGGPKATLTALTAFTDRPLGNPWTPHAADAHAAAGLRILADAIAEVAPGTPNQVDVVRTLARAIDVAPPGTIDADVAHDAFDRVGRVLTDIQSDRAPNLTQQAAAVREAAEKVSVTRPLCEQRDVVVAFFARSRDLLVSVQ
jgi:hypothetical protein